MPLRRSIRAPVTCFAVLLTTIVGATSVATSAHAWPDRPVTIVVTSGAGNAGDLIARMLSAPLTQAWGQPVVVQNVPGAAGAIGTERVARSAPDGHTLVMPGDAAIVVRPNILPRLSYDPRRDLVAITLNARMPNLLVVRASDGPGTSIQLGAEMLRQAATLDMTGIGYPTMGGIIQDVLAGRPQMSFVNAFAAGPIVRDGQLRALGVSSAERLQSLPDVPTFASLGFLGFEASAWFGLLAPGATPAPIVARIRADVHAALADPALRGRLDTMAAMLVDSTPEAFTAFIAAELQRMAMVLAAAGITTAP